VRVTLQSKDSTVLGANEIRHGRPGRPAEACRLSHHLIHGVDDGGMAQPGDGLYLLNGDVQLHADWGRAQT
jgi:hypothetical protein